MTPDFIAPTEWWLKLPPSLESDAWQQSERCSTLSRCWNAYLNQVCLDVVLSWIQSEYAPAAAWLHPNARAAVWELVNGSAIVLNSTRLVLLPSEVIDDAELEVPQEWVDIPDWVADYYFAVQVKLDPPDDSWIRVWSYTTHQALKTQGHYDPDDRTYCLNREHLNRDLSTFGFMLQFCSQAQTRAAIAPLPPLPVAQADYLIQRLATPSVTFPRLAVPFSLWAALLERQEWRQRLYQQRVLQGNSNQVDTPVQLSQWFQNRFTAGWQSIQSLLEPEAEPFAFGLRSSTTEPEVVQVRSIPLIALSQSQSVVLVVKLSAEAEERVGVVAQVHPAPNQAFLPSQLTLSLLSERGEVLQSVQAGEHDDYIQLRRFRCLVGTPFRLQILWNAVSVTEDFMI